MDRGRVCMKRRLMLKEPIGVALETLRSHKMRSFLMLLGIILSVSTLIVVIALISGVNRYIADRVANMKLPLRVGVELRIDGKVRAGSHALNDTNIRGVTSNMVDIDIVTPRDGRYISEGDDQSRAQVTMIGNDLAVQLFPGVDPIGHELSIDGRPFLIVGIAKIIGTAFGQSQDNFTYIPIQTYFKMYGTNDTVWLNIQARGAEWMEQTQDEARAMMRARRHLPPNEKDNFGIFDQATLMELWKNLTGVIATAMVGVVSVFLVIGGVVIMNVMLATVTERTREIGIT